MAKQKSVDYILGMITGASLMLALWACTSNDLIANDLEVQEVKIVNEIWDPANVKVIP